MTQLTLAYEVTQAVAASTDDPALYSLLKENDTLRQKNHDLAQALHEALAELERQSRTVATLRQAIAQAVGKAL